MKKIIKEARSMFVYYIILKPTQTKKERKESNNQIPPTSKKRISEKYKDLEKVFQIDLTAIIPLNKRRIHSIDLKKSKILPFYSIYLLTAKELIIL